MLDFLTNNTFVEIGGRAFQQIVGIPIGAFCAPLLADLFLYSHEADSDLLQNNNKKLGRLFNFTFRYIACFVIDILRLVNISTKYITAY